MRGMIVASVIGMVLVGCGKNEPGTMGGEPATPRTVATGAPEATAVTNAQRSAIESEHAISSFDDVGTNSSTLPQASSTNRPPTP